MKKKYLLFLSLFIVQKLFCQTLPFSTLGQVFNYSVGDSFEYDYANTGCYDIQGSTGIYECSGISLLIITSVASAGDTTINEYSYVSMSTGGAGAVCEPTFGYSGPGQLPFPSAYGETYDSADIIFKVFSPDSLINTLYENSGPPGIDTAFADSNYNYYKQNHITAPGIDEIYTDSIGLTYMWDFGDECGSANYGLQLIWYHKAGGEQWGQEVPIIIQSINDLNETAVSVKLFPNPSVGNVNLQLSALTSYDDYFELFDASGRKVYQQKIVSDLTEMHLNNFSSGFYLWRFKSANQILKRGKLILE